MHINITDSEKGKDTGSSGQLVHYLDKENRLDAEKAPELWFNGDGLQIESYEVKSRIDQNIAKLCRDEAKFFLINVSPSQKEIAHLKALYKEEDVKKVLKAYAVKVMDEYARNFNRPGIQSHKDLLWYGKVENYRYYSHKDAAVKKGLKKAGERKEGEQLHVQIIVSRKDISNKIKLSPMNNSDGKNQKHSKRMGEFNRSAFKHSGEKLFDQLFRFERGLKETFAYANTQKNGSLEERLAIQEKIASGERKNDREITPVPQSQETLSPTFMDLLLAKADYDPLNNQLKKKRKKKGQQTDVQQGL
ncbi:DUF5712 family protein [Pedobacter sp. MC2016-24]|uniref:DUF5712 family protein n=1 Tax=Pedobacter sp. MC2016-24 TaxID=2780090 RepID=UPI00187E7DAF|nr:DUF5712 family protein [Pedobacter sp. MC2016-24]MBE9599933.1 molybdopterin-guanine dinucleotide biosynthesis protein MobB [Pedobacter sp. MC2016-24]